MVSVQKSSKDLDHGYSWVVMIAGACVEFFSRSVANSFGVLFNELKTDFNTGNTEISLLSGLIAGTSSVLVPIVSVLVTKYSCRTLVIIGGFLIASGLCLSYFANTVTLILLTFGIICGMGQSFTYVSTVIIVNQYFLHRFTIANGVRLGGVSCGTIVLSLLVPFLITEYGASGTILIMGSMALNIIPIGILYRPRKKNLGKTIVPTISGQVNEGFEMENGNIKTPFHIPNSMPLQNQKCHKNVELISYQFINEEVNSKITDFSNIEFSEKSAYSLQSTSIALPVININESTSEKNIVCTLLRNPLFVVVILSMTFIVWQFTNLIAILPAHAENLGLSKTESALLITIESSTEFASRLSCGIIFDKLNFRIHHCYMYGCLLTSINTIIIAFANSFWLLSALAAAWGVIEGVHGTISAPLFAETFGKENMHAVLGIFNPFRALFVIFAPLITGFMADYYQSFTPSILLLASVAFISFLLFVLSLYLPNYKKLHKTGL